MSQEIQRTMEVSEASLIPPDAMTPDDVALIRAQATDLVQGVRRLSHDLHPSTLRHVGLAAALCK